MSFLRKLFLEDLCNSKVGLYEVQLKEKNHKGQPAVVQLKCGSQNCDQLKSSREKDKPMF